MKAIDIGTLCLCVRMNARKCVCDVYFGCFVPDVRYTLDIPHFTRSLSLSLHNDLFHIYDTFGDAALFIFHCYRRHRLCCRRCSRYCCCFVMESILVRCQFYLRLKIYLLDVVEHVHTLPKLDYSICGSEYKRLKAMIKITNIECSPLSLVQLCALLYLDMCIECISWCVQVTTAHKIRRTCIENDGRCLFTKPI